MANETIIINDDLRTMQIPSSITLLGVESDDDVNRIPFQMPKEYCGFDLSTFEARINYMNANGIGDIYIVDDLEEDGDDPSLMNFTWLVGRNACAYKGNTKFIVCLKKFDANQNVIQEFNTTVYSLPVLEGLETTEAVVQQNADIIEYILKAIEDAGSIDLSNYYTKAQVDALKLANPYKLNINGTDYDGSQPVEMTIEGGSSATTETASGTIIHVTDAVPNEEVKSLQLLDSNASPISSAVICITNKNLFRIDLLADQTVNKGVTFDKTDDGSIHATGTTTGTYASAQVNLDPTMFVEGETYTLSSGKKTGGNLYVQLILNYTDNTTDYIVANSTPYTFSIGKTVASAIGSVQITNSGVTVDEWVYPMLELADSASAFVNNVFNSMTYTGATMPTLPDSISNIWSTNASVDNIIMEYWNDPILAQVNELEKQFYQTISHDDALKADSEKAVQNKVVTAALATKIAYPAAGAVGQVLSKTADGAVWSNAGAPTDEQATDAVNAWLENHPEATTTVEDGSISVDKLASDTVALINKKSGITENVKQALLNLLAHVAFIDDHGQDYYDDLEDALYPPTNLASISAIFNQGANVIYDTDDLDDLEQYLTVVANYTDSTHETIYDYVLSGTLTAGTSTITVTYGGKTTTFNVTVTERVLSSISAVYTQSGTVYDTDSLDSLKNNLVVTALYSDASTETVPSTDYTLSGTLAEGTSTITVSYGGKTATFNVTVTAEPLVPSEYQQVEYIESASPSTTTGCVTIDATLAGNGDVEIEMGIMALSAPSSNGYYFNVSSATNNNNVGIGIHTDAHTDIAVKLLASDEGAISIQPNGGSSILNQKYDLTATVTSTTATLSDGTHTASESKVPRTRAGKISVFGIRKYNNTQYTNFMPCRIYNLTLTEAGVKKIDLIPCYRKSDNAVGFYNTVTGIFNTNSGLTVGSNV